MEPVTKLSQLTTNDNVKSLGVTVTRTLTQQSESTRQLSDSVQQMSDKIQTSYNALGDKLGDRFERVLATTNMLLQQLVEIQDGKNKTCTCCSRSLTESFGKARIGPPVGRDGVCFLQTHFARG